MIKSGIHPNFDPREYHAWAFNPEEPAKGPISLSLLKRFAELGPLAFRAAPSAKQTKAMSHGSLVDCLLFTPELFPREFVAKSDCPDLSANGAFASKAAREWRDEKLESGATIITDDEMSAASTAWERLTKTPIVEEILEEAHTQVALVGETSEVPLKGLVDIVPTHMDHDDCLADLKTTAANIYDDNALARHVGTFRYHWQAAFYLQMWNNLNPDDKRQRWKLVFQSSSAPYEARVVELDPLMIDAGRAAISVHLPRLIGAMKSGNFRSLWSNKETLLAPHNPTIYAEEAMAETLEEVAC